VDLVVAGSNPVGHPMPTHALFMWRFRQFFLELPPILDHTEPMRWLFNVIRSLFSSRASNITRPQLLGMYFQESNQTRRKPNRARN
jgi:hypothetical protein